MANKEVGTVTHWYDKIGVAVIKLSAPLAVGDMVKIVRGDEEFDEKIASMQLDHEDVAKGKKGQDIAVKLSQRAKEGAVVYKE